MPELPEVETIKNDLKEKILDKKIIKITCRKRKIVKNNFNFFLNTLIGNKFSNIKRIGKLLIFEINRENLYLLIHLKMTGQLVYCPSRGIVAGGHSYPEQKNTVESAAEAMCLPNKYSHVIFNFADGSNLFFNDMRQFGYFKTVRKDELEIIKKNFGIEPLASNFKLNNFKRIFIKRKAPVKALLLNQKLIAGIGNIYAD